MTQHPDSSTFLPRYPVFESSYKSYINERLSTILEFKTEEKK